MAITFVGFFRLVEPTEADINTQRQAGSPLEAYPEFFAKVREFPSKLPSTCKLIGSWAVTGGQAPNVIVVEVESYDDLQFINNYYLGWLDFEWHPTTTGGVQRT